MIGPLVAGCSAELIRRYDVSHDHGSVDACHLCYQARAALCERFPEILGPPQVYGLDDSPEK